MQTEGNATFSCYCAPVGGARPTPSPGSRSGRRSVARPFLGVGAGCAASLGLAWAAVRVSSTLVAELARPGPASPPDALALVCASAALMVASWLSACTLLALLESLPGWLGETAGALARRVTPAAARRWAAVLLGASIGGVLWPGPAVADTPPHATSASRSWAAREAWSGAEGGSGARTRSSSDGILRSPGWSPSVDNQVEHVSGPEVLVRPGDTLWGLAARSLGAEASAATVAEEWPRWYAVNRAVIGPDPDLLLPGQRLRTPRYTPSVDGDAGDRG